MFQIFTLFIFGHFLADWPLQTDFMAKFKVPNSMKGWQWVLLGHSATHGAMVLGSLLIAGHELSVAIGFGIVETVLHFMIDVAKPTFGLSLNVDQWLHIACKVAYVALLATDSGSVLRVAVYVSLGSALFLSGIWVNYAMDKFGGKV